MIKFMITYGRFYNLICVRFRYSYESDATATPFVVTLQAYQTLACIM